MSKETWIKLIFVLGLIWMVADAFLDPQPDPQHAQHRKVQ